MKKYLALLIVLFLFAGCEADFSYDINESEGGPYFVGNEYSVTTIVDTTKTPTILEPLYTYRTEGNEKIKGEVLDEKVFEVSPRGTNGAGVTLPKARNLKGEFEPGIYYGGVSVDDNFYLQDVIVYEDGMIRVGGYLYTFEEFQWMVKSSNIITRLPKNSEVLLCIGLSCFNAVISEDYSIYEDDFIQEVKDMIDALNGSPTSSQVCADAYREFVKNQNEESKAKLSEAYFKVPKHFRNYLLGDMDNKDDAILTIISTDDGIEKWRKRYGEEYEYN